LTPDFSWPALVPVLTVGLSSRPRGVPVLVIVGAKDYLTPVVHSEAILKHLPEAELVKIENSGHVVMLEKADEVDAALLPFLEKIA